MLNITPPPAIQGDEQAQLQQVYRYLFRLSEQLNMALGETQKKVDYIQLGKGGQGGLVSENKLNDDLTKQYNTLKSLIIKTADVVRLEMDQIITNLDSVYVAESEWGTYKEEVSREIIDTAKYTVENFEYGEEILNIPAMAVDFEAYKIEASGYIKRGIIGYDDMGYPIIGIAIGQDLRGREVTIDGVVYEEFDTTHNMATYASDKLSFWINGIEVAYLSNSELVITRAIISDSIQLGDWNIEVNAMDGLTIQQRIGNEIVTASQINLVADQIDLSGNESIVMTAKKIDAVAEQVNVVADQIDIRASETISFVVGETKKASRTFRQENFPTGEDLVRPNDLLIVPSSGQTLQAVDMSDLNLQFHIDEDGNLYYSLEGSTEEYGFEFINHELYANGIAFTLNDDGSMEAPYWWMRVQDGEMVQSIEHALGKAEFATIYESATPPDTVPEVGKLWMDYSRTPPLLRRWKGGSDPADMDNWEIVINTAELIDAQKKLEEQQYALKTQQEEIPIHLTIDKKVVVVGKKGSTSEVRIDNKGMQVYVGEESFSSFEASLARFGNMYIRKPDEIGGLMLDARG